MLLSALPPSIDYSQYIAFTRTQGRFGGCFIYAALYVIDILKEKEHPYTPDLSYRFAQYYYDDQKVDQKKVHVDYGSCPEAILHTDYDALVWVVDHFDDSQCPQPTPQIALEAKLYRIADTSEYITPTVNALKTLLVQKGPLWSMGTISGVAHCVAIVGYDDSQNAFKFINSWGDRWNGDGYGLIPYNQVGKERRHIFHQQAVRARRYP
jgi:C1A family cysteine protease